MRWNEKSSLGEAGKESSLVKMKTAPVGFKDLEGLFKDKTSSKKKEKNF